VPDNPVPIVSAFKFEPSATPEIVELASCALVIVPLNAVVGIVVDAVTALLPLAYI